MEVGGSAGGGGLLCGAAQEPRKGDEEERAGAERRGGGMKFHVSARAPHGLGALLLIGGAVLAGAAVVAWRHARRGKDGKGGAESRHRDRPPAKKEVLDDVGVVEDENKDGASAREIDLPDDDLSGEKEKIEIESNNLDGEITEEIQEVKEDAEIATDESNSESAEKLDHDSRGEPTEISMHDVDSEHVEKSDQSSSTNPSEISTHDADCATGEERDVNSAKNGIENNQNLTKSDTESDQDSTKNSTENENSSKNELKKEIAQNDNEDLDISDQTTLSVKGPGIILNKSSVHNDGAQEAESMENTPTAQLMMHQEHLLKDMTTDTETDNTDAKVGEGTIIDKTQPMQEKKKAPAGSVELASSPAVPSLVKTTEKEESEPPRRNETGMKIEQDYTNGELKEDGLISKGGATPGGAVVTLDRRSASLAVLALMFAVTIGITIAVRLYAFPRATRLQMNLE